MSSPFKKAYNFGSSGNLLRNVFDAAGVSNKNFFRKHMDPFGGLERSFRADGLSGIKDYIKSGELTDPDHAFHKTPDTSSPEAPPTATDGAAQGLAARDRIRRRVYRAQGRSSTIRSSYGGMLGGGNQLLGS